MYLTKQLFIFLLLVGFISPSFAAVDGVNITSCGVVYDDAGDDKKEDGKKEDEEEEEPDCE